MKKLLGSFLAVALLTSQVAAQSNPAFDLQDPADGHTTGTINGNTNVLDMVGGYTENGSNTLSNDVSGNAGTATSLSANGANCSAGSAPLGVDASGAAESCTDYLENVSEDASPTLGGDLAGADFALLNISTGHINGQLTVGGLVSCDTIDTDANGVMSCGTDATGGAGSLATVLSSVTWSGSSGSNSSFAVCEASAPITTTGGLVRYSVVTSPGHNQAASNTKVHLLRSDGTTSSFVEGNDQDTGCTNTTSSGASHQGSTTCAGTDFVASGTSASYTYCVGYAVDGGSGWILAIEGLHRLEVTEVNIQ